MSDLFRALQALRSLRDSLNPKWEQPIVDHFRVAFLDGFEKAKLDYCRKAVEGHFLPDTKVAKLLGYSSSSAVDAIREGKISLEKFDLVRETIGKHVPFPSGTARRIETFIETTDFVRCELMKQQPTMVFDITAYHCIEQSFAEDRTAYQLEHENDERGWMKHLLARVQSVVPAKQFEQPAQLVKLLMDWGPAYLTTKLALANLVKE